MWSIFKATFLTVGYTLSLKEPVQESIIYQMRLFYKQAHSKQDGKL